MDVWTASLVIMASTAAIFIFGRRFAQASSAIGDYLRLPRDVKGATFDAVASSLPELFVALFAVIVFREFDIGIGTIAGSALFNLLVIPGLCVLVAPGVFQVSQKVLTRDGLYYLISIVLLLFLLVTFKTWGLLVALVLLLVYFWYVRDIVSYTRTYKEKNKSSSPEIHLSKEILIFLFNLMVIGVSAYFLTDAAVALSNALGIPGFVIAFTIVAAATSVPDMVISVANARRGDVDDATSNVFGSNVFDILVGLGFPLLLYVLLKGPLMMEFARLEIIIGLLGSTLLVLYFFGKDRILTKPQGIKLLFLYCFFVTYGVLLS